MAPTWPIGIGISLIANILSSISPNLQKYALQRSERPEYQRMRYGAQIILVIGNLLDFLALSFASPSIIAPMASVILPSNFIIAHQMFGGQEPWNRHDIYATITVLTGTILLISFGDHSDTDYDVPTLYNNWSNKIFIGYFVILWVMVLAGTNHLRIYTDVPRRQHQASSETARSPYMGDRISQSPINRYVTMQEIIIHDLNQNHELLNAPARSTPIYTKSDLRYCVCLCIISGILSSMSILFGRMVMALIKTSMQGNNQMNHQGTWYFIMILIVLIIAQIYYMNRALKRFQLLLVVPLFQSVFISMSTVSSIIYFQEYRNFATIQWFMISLALIIIIAGAVWLEMNQIRKDKLAQILHQVEVDITDSIEMSLPAEDAQI